MCNVDYDPPDFTHTTIVRARKPHTCGECRRVIERGELYQRTSGKWDRTVQSMVTCAHCEVLQDWIGSECGGWLYGEVIEDVREHLQEYGVSEYGFAVARLVVHAQNQWRRNGALVAIPATPPTSFDRRKAALQ